MHMGFAGPLVGRGPPPKRLMTPSSFLTLWSNDGRIHNCQSLITEGPWSDSRDAWVQFWWGQEGARLKAVENSLFTCQAEPDRECCDALALLLFNIWRQLPSSAPEISAVLSTTGNTEAALKEHFLRNIFIHVTGDSVAGEGVPPDMTNTCFNQQVNRTFQI